MEFKYKASFSSQVKVIVPADKDKYLAVASLSHLKSLLPDGLNLEENPDLLFIAGNLAVGGVFNGNGDGISNATAVKIAPFFKYKFMDIEHSRAKVVGAIFTSGFSEYGGTQMLTEEEASASDKPFNIAVGGVIWPVVYPGLDELILEAADETSANFGRVSFSWEVGFNDFDIALGDKEIAKASIVPREDREQYVGMLRSLGGSGKTKDGTPVFRIIPEDCVPLGLGLVTTPAADVRGVVVSRAGQEPEDTTASVIRKLENVDESFRQTAQALTDKLLEIAENTNLNKENSDKNSEKAKNNSHAANVVVNNNSIMKKFTKLEDITDENLQEASAAAVTNFIGKYVGDKIEEVSNQFAEQLEAKEKEAKAKEAKAQEIQQKLDDTLAEIDRVKADLQKEQETRAAQQREADFNNRMADLDAKYNLDDKDRSYIVKDIQGLDDSAYATWVEKFEVFAAAKKKQPAAPAATPDPASAQQLLDQAKANQQQPLPNNAGSETSIKAQFAEAFPLEAFKIQK